MRRPIVVLLASGLLAGCWSSGSEQADGTGEQPSITVAAPASPAMTGPKGCAISATGATQVTVTIPDRPGLVASDHWFTTEELAQLGDGFGSLLLSCTSEAADLAAWSTETVAMQPGAYAIGLTGPFTVSGRVGDDTIGPVSDGTLTIERFDLAGITATMSVEMSSLTDPSRTYQVAMTVNLGCRGLSLCAAAPSVNQ